MLSMTRGKSRTFLLIAPLNGQIEDGIFSGKKFQRGLRESRIVHRIGFEVWGDFEAMGIGFMGWDKGGGGQTDGGVVVVEVIDGLDEVFSEGIVTEDGGTFVVFECSGEEFRGAGGMLIYEQGYREMKGLWVGDGAVDFFILF